MENSMISVIVPVYKSEDYLNRCIHSILNQTYGDFELILVDDNSPDHCPELCDAWEERDGRIKVIHQDNKGASSARNTGLRAATGEFVIFVDSDDWIEAEMFERLVSFIRQHGADMCLTDWQSNNGSQKISNKESPKVEIWGRKECLDRFFRVNGEDSHYYMVGCLFRKKFLESFSFLEGRMNEDVLANYLFAVHCKKAVHTDEVFYNYFVNPQGVTRKRFTAKKMDLLIVWELVAEQVAQESPEYAYACKMNQKRAEFTLLSRMLLDGYDRHDPELRDIKKELKSHVRKDFWDLMRWKMPLSRKVLLWVVCVI